MKKLFMVLALILSVAVCGNVYADDFAIGFGSLSEGTNASTAVGNSNGHTNQLGSGHVFDFDFCDFDQENSLIIDGDSFSQSYDVNESGYYGNGTWYNQNSYGTVVESNTVVISKGFNCWSVGGNAITTSHESANNGNASSSAVGNYSAGGLNVVGTSVYTGQAKGSSYSSKTNLSGNINGVVHSAGSQMRVESEFK